AGRRRKFFQGALALHRQRELEKRGNRHLIGRFGAEQVDAVNPEELRVDQRRIGEKPLVIVDLIELPELRAELTDGRLEVREHRRKLAELVEEKERLFDAGLVLFER